MSHNHHVNLLKEDLPLVGTKKLRTQIPNILGRHPNNITTVDQLCQLTPAELMDIEYFGLKSLEAVVTALHSVGRQLAADPDVLHARKDTP